MQSVSAGAAGAAHKRATVVDGSGDSRAFRVSVQARVFGVGVGTPAHGLAASGEGRRGGYRRSHIAPRWAMLLSGATSPTAAPATLSATVVPPSPQRPSLAL